MPSNTTLSCTDYNRCPKLGKTMLIKIAIQLLKRRFILTPLNVDILGMRRLLPIIFTLFLALFARTGRAVISHPPEAAGLAVELKGSSKVLEVKLPASVSIAEAVLFLKKNPAVEVVEPNYLYHSTQEVNRIVVNRNAVDFYGAFFNPNDPHYADQWYLRKIQAPSAWEKTTGSLDVKVAILDTGVYWQHPDLVDNIYYNFKEKPGDGLDNDHNGYIDDIHGWDFVGNDNDPSPDFKDLNITKQGINHGTIVAGIIGAMGNNERGVTGVNWRVSMIPVRVLNSHGSGSVVNVEKGIRYAMAQGADIINLSFVGTGYSELLYRAIQDAYDKGILVVAASGNDTAEVQDLDNSSLYPVCFAGPHGENIILGVAASDGLDQRASFSSIGTSCIDITAPGTGFFTTTAFNPASPDALGEYYSDGWSGTSVAAPLVSGVAALAKSLDKTLTAKDLISLITQNSENIYDKNPGMEGKLGKGRLNAYLVVQAVTDRLRAAANGFLHQGSLVLTAGANEKPYVRVFNLEGPILREAGKILALPENFKTGLGATVGDFNGDGFPDLVTTPLQNGGSQVRIWKSDGTLAGSFLAFDKSQTNGLRAAAVNLDGSASNLLVVGSQTGPSRVQVYTEAGILFNSFPVFPNANYPVNVAVGDLNRDGLDEIVVSPRVGPPLVRVFDAQGNLLKEFMAYPKGAANGVRVAIVDTNNTGWKEIATIPANGVPEVRLYGLDGRLLTPPWRVAGLVNRATNTIATADLNNDGKQELLLYSGLDPLMIHILDNNGAEVLKIDLHNTGFRTIGDMVYVK